MDCDFKLQQCIYESLNVHPFIKDRNIAVYDDVPQDPSTPYPFILIGETITTEENTSNTNGFRFSVVVQVWSRYDGRKEVKEIQQAVYECLHRQEFDLSPAKFITSEFDTARQFLDADGKSRRGVQTFDVLVDL